MTNYRPLTKKEQLEYQLHFLKQYKEALEKKIEEVEKEYEHIRKKEKTK